MMPAQVTVNGLTDGVFIAIAAVGFAIHFHAQKFFDFGFAGSLLGAAYGTQYSVTALGMHPVTAAACGVLIAVTMGAAGEILVYRPLRLRGSTALVRLVTSLGMLAITTNLLSLLFGDAPIAVANPTEAIVLFGGSIRATPVEVYATCVGAVAIASCMLVLHRTTLGLELRAQSDDVLLAKAIGLDVNRLALSASVLGSAMGGLAGSLLSLDVGVVPALGLSLLLPALTAVIIGGARRVAIVGVIALVLGIVLQMATWVTSAGWRDAVLFTLIVLTLLGRPKREGESSSRLQAA